LTYVHWYGKGESRPGRKLGHITVLADSQETGRWGDGEMEAILLAKAQLIEDIWYH
jgi:5-(carboxyamino)imidazole ribonucleotide synthase